MALTHDYSETIAARIRHDPAFARALLAETAALFLDDEPDTARLVLRELVNATVGIETLAADTAKPAKSLHRMLAKGGNPTMDNLAAILGVVRERLGAELGACRRSGVREESMARTLMHPCEISVDGLCALSLNAAELAGLLEVPRNRISQALAVKCAISAQTAFCPSHFILASEASMPGDAQSSHGNLPQYFNRQNIRNTILNEFLSLCRYRLDKDP